jgi:CRISPR-associated exonuclease Cas4
MAFMDLYLILLFLVLCLLTLAAAFQLLSKRESSSAKTMRMVYGIPDGKVIYSDLDRPGKALYSKKLGISGKPDYIVKGKGRNLIPVEIKSGRAKEPHKNHIMQLAAYCYLVEENYHRSVPYGIIVYSDGVQHRINFDKNLRSDLLATVDEMKSALRHDCPKRAHSYKQRCLHCSFNSSCKRSLL